MPTETPAIAAIIMPGGELRQACVGCCAICHAAGVLAIVAAMPELVVYKVAAGHTLEECRALVQQEH
jgi:hypothetical protein